LSYLKLLSTTPFAVFAHLSNSKSVFAVSAVFSAVIAVSLRETNRAIAVKRQENLETAAVGSRHIFSWHSWRLGGSGFRSAAVFANNFSRGGGNTCF
jgi:hypothetical protein